MTLQSFADSSSNGISLPEVDAELGREIQSKLTALGILDPPIGQRDDGTFGPLSDDDGLVGAYTTAMMAVFAAKAKVTFSNGMLTPALARALVNAGPDTFYPLILEPDPRDRARRARNSAKTADSTRSDAAASRLDSANAASASASARSS